VAIISALGVVLSLGIAALFLFWTYLVLESRKWR